MKTTVSIVIPVHNEEAIIEHALTRLVAEFRPLTGDFEILPVENGSRDRTWEIMQTLSAKEPSIRPLRSPRADYGFALKHGIRESRGEFILSDEIDVLDHGFHAAALQALATADLIIASKRHPDAVDDRGLFRTLGTDVITGMLRLACGLKSSDTHGPKGWRASVARDLVARSRLDGDLFASESVIRAERMGLHLRELPLSISEHRATSIPLLKRVPRVIRDIWKLRQALAEDKTD